MLFPFNLHSAQHLLRPEAQNRAVLGICSKASFQSDLSSVDPSFDGSGPVGLGRVVSGRVTTHGKKLCMLI